MNSFIESKCYFIQHSCAVESLPSLVQPIPVTTPSHPDAIAFLPAGYFPIPIVHKPIHYYSIESDRTIQVLVTFLNKEAITTTDSRGQQMAAILEKLAQSQAFSQIEPLVWQRQIRQDREHLGGV